MFNPELLNKLFLAASMQRWNDHPRPVLLTELDKQAHKMVIAHLLGRLMETAGRSVSWGNLAKFGLFDMLLRVSLTDIKPQVFNKLRLSSNARNGMNLLVLKETGGLVASVRMELGSDLQEYMRTLDDPKAQKPIEQNILRAAHYMASVWEYKLVNSLRIDIKTLDDPRQDLSDRLDEYVKADFPFARYYQESIGVTAQQPNGQVFEDVDEGFIKFVDLVGSLRFQKRWSHSPRLPETSVLGHMYFVSLITYLLLVDMGKSDGVEESDLVWRSFLSALYHDLPEALTRDIISPVKTSAKLSDDLQVIELDVVNDILGLLSGNIEFQRDIRLALPHTKEANYLLKDGTMRPVGEFDSRELSSNKILQFDKDTVSVFKKIEKARALKNRKIVVGEIIKVADDLAAYIEARSSIAHGVSSSSLVKAEAALYEKYRSLSIGDTDIGAYFEYFKFLEW